MVSIRTMTQADKTALMALLRDTPEFEPAEVPVAEEVVDASLAAPGQDYYSYAAEEGGKLLGFITFGSTPLTQSTWDIYWMAVARSARGQGVGGALLRRAEEAIQKAGGHLILIETSSKPNYLNTRRFYRKQGYRQIGRVQDFYAPGDHLVNFEKRV
jgi:ribosomal protein S18 acetylase RimI-like enzyme